MRIKKFNKILKELRSSMQMLVSDDMLEEFKLTKNNWGYTVEIHTQTKDGNLEIPNVSYGDKQVDYSVL